MSQSAPPANPQESLLDDRGASRGWGRLVYLLYWIAGVSTVLVSLWMLLMRPEQPVGERLISFFAGALYVTAAVGLMHNGKRMRVVAWSCIAVSLAGPIIVGLLGIDGVGDPAVWSPWAEFGKQVWFVSLWLPLVGMVWLWWSNPRRIVELSEEIDRYRSQGNG